MELALLFGLGVAFVACVWTYTDASLLRERGMKLTPALWAILVFLALILALPVYLIFRFTVWQKQVR